MINPFFLGGVALGVALLFGGVYVYNKGFSNGVTETTAKVTEQVLQDQIAARAKEKQWQNKLNTITKDYESKITDIKRKHNAIVISLQQRPSRTDRLPDDTKVSCKAATGAELSREDGQFLTGEATRADELRSALETCYNVLDGVGE